MTNAADEGRERAAAAEDPLESFDEQETSVTSDPFADPAQAEWERDGEIPEEDLPDETEQPESQGDEPDLVDLGDDGEGDLAPEDH